MFLFNKNYIAKHLYVQSIIIDFRQILAFLQMLTVFLTLSTLSGCGFVAGLRKGLKANSRDSERIRIFSGAAASSHSFFE